MDSQVLDWLLEGDPAIRWQVERDLLDLPASQWDETRKTVGQTGWAHELLSKQDAGGTWASGLYQPKWTSTNYTLLLLRRMGLDPSDGHAGAGCLRLVNDATWLPGGLTYWPSHGYAERCVNAMVLSVCAYFEVQDVRIDSIAEALVVGRLEDGAWNCRDRQGATHSSFHTTISVLEALDLWRACRGTDDADEAIAAGIEFLLQHQMFRSHRDGSIINPEWLKAHFPPRWHYDVLRGLDFLASVGAAPDARASDAVDLIESSRRTDRRWPKGSQYTGEVFLTLEPGRVAGRWNTLRALRVLRWWSQRW
ncbi:MAG: hypothetical protein ACR2NG_09360 [Acidimicrobiia bacterium]